MSDKDAINILLIDDDIDDVRVLQRLLLRMPQQYNVDHGSTLSEGLQLTSTSQYQVIFTDLGLPDATGLEAITALNQACPDAAVIAHTGLNEEPLRIEALSQGAVDFLSKQDLSAISLKRCISENLHRSQLQENIRCLYRAMREKKEMVEAQAAKLTEQARELEEKNQNLKKLCDSAQKFINNVSHEFRTPLCVVKQYSSLIADAVVGPVNDEQTRMLRVIEDRVDDLNNMVDDMLDINRHEAGLLAAARKQCHATEIIERVLPVLQQRASLRDIRIETEFDPALPAIFCDPEKVTRTLINLAVNAIKFSPPNSIVRIKVTSEPTKKQIRISIQDQGDGIPADQQKQIFKRFRRLNEPRESSTIGFGLGLNIAEELVELNLGSMALKSTVGEGSTFSFTVPFQDADEILKRHIQRSTAASGPTYFPISVVRISNPNAAFDGEQHESEEIQAFLNNLLFSRDLLLPFPPNEWLVFLATNSQGIEGFAKRLNKQIETANRNRPIGKLPALQLEPIGTFDAVSQAKRLYDLIPVEAHA